MPDDKAVEQVPNQIPAYKLWVEIATRVTSQPLHYRSGNEEAAAESVAKLFEKTRALLSEHHDAVEFRREALRLLNVVLRPYTERWRGWLTEDKPTNDPEQKGRVFRDELVRRMFRTELLELQRDLKPLQGKFARMAGVEHGEHEAPERKASLGTPIEAGVGTQIDIEPWPPPPLGNAAYIRINAAEHRDILERRRILAGSEKAENHLENAIGLALSGGGIRSATYCLGIVQELVRRGLFPQFDYLSTVSGGGYFGTFISCALGTNSKPPEASKSKEPDDDSRSAKGAAVSTPPSPSDQNRELHRRIHEVFLPKESKAESGLIRHLRNNSKYLLNGGMMAKLRIAGLLVSGILCNMLMVLPIPLFAALLAYVIEKSGFWSLAPASSSPSVWPPPGAPAGVVQYWALVASAFTLLLLPLIQKLAHGKPPASLHVALRRGFVVFALGMGLMTLAATGLYIQPVLFHYYEVVRIAFEDYGGLLERISEWGAPVTAGTGSVVLGLVATSLKSTWPRLKAAAAHLFILSGPVFFVFLYLMVANRLGVARNMVTWDPLDVGVVATVLALWSIFFVNINTLAPHVYYRARLCECYLARRLPDPPEPAGRHPARTLRRKWLTGEFAQRSTESVQQVPLTELGSNPAAPYHLINTTLNLPGSDNKDLRGRDGDFFLVSRHYCGSPIVGYVATKDLERADPHFDLGTAMAVSGAAASTSMGWKSLPNFRFLITMLNVRLGYWIPWLTPRNPGVRYFFREMVASMDEHSPLLNLSDGGHIENLGTYELLRRKCKFIVCVDGGQEPGMECADLTRLQRYAEIDLGIQFEYGIADLSIQPNGFSRSSGILVKIIYSRHRDGTPHELGWMLYLKLAVVGIEPVYVLDYRRENPEFPHQSTGDQIYDEAQFEAYRRLGECAAERLFRSEIIGNKPVDTVENWFQALADTLLADNDPVFKTPEQSIVAAGPAKQ